MTRKQAEIAYSEEWERFCTDVNFGVQMRMHLRTRDLQRFTRAMKAYRKELDRSPDTT
jgi:hypothetical protein